MKLEDADSSEISESFCQNTHTQRYFPENSNLQTFITIL